MELSGTPKRKNGKKQTIRTEKTNSPEPFDTDPGSFYVPGQGRGRKGAGERVPHRETSIKDFRGIKTSVRTGIYSTVP